MDLVRACQDATNMTMSRQKQIMILFQLRKLLDMDWKIGTTWVDSDSPCSESIQTVLDRSFGLEQVGLESTFGKRPSSSLLWRRRLLLTGSCRLSRTWIWIPTIGSNSITRPAIEPDSRKMKIFLKGSSTIKKIQDLSRRFRNNQEGSRSL